MAYTFIKLKNGSIGKSLVEDEFLKLALEILDEAKKQNVQLHLPIDSLCSKEFSNDSETYLDQFLVFLTMKWD